VTQTAATETGEDIPRRRRRASAEQIREATRNRDLVVDATRAIYEETGVLGSMNQIAARAGVGKGTLYRGFPNREALLSAVAMTQLQEIKRLATSALDGEPDPGIALSRFIHELMAYNSANGLHLELFRQGLPPEVKKELDIIRVPIAALVVRAREHRAVRPEIVADDLHFMLTACVLYLSGQSATGPGDWLRAERLILNSLGLPANNSAPSDARQNHLPGIG
jgi:AcrR family transcriptional regulator